MATGSNYEDILHIMYVVSLEVICSGQQMFDALVKNYILFF